MTTPQTFSPESCASRCDRSGAILIWFALLLVVILGMVGLVLDAGMLMAAQRQAQNAADAAALAAAQDKLLGKTNAQAIATATTFVKTYNPDRVAVSIADPQVNLPPSSGPYAGKSGFVEVVATFQVNTFLIHLIPGVSRQQTIKARGVAGPETVDLDEGVVVLDPSARPGLSVSGNAQLLVNGSVYSNSEGGGVDQNGNPVNNGNSGTSISVTGNGGIWANDVYTVGGVNSPNGFHDFWFFGPNPLHAKQVSIGDPLQFLPTPTTANGVDATFRGTPTSSNSSQTTNDPSGKNFVQTVSGVRTMYLFPGIYNSITISGGNVNFYPGIYVLRAQTTGATVLSITGGNIDGRGVMFYNTGNNYDPITGTPDVNDGAASPPAGDGAALGKINLAAPALFTPIDTSNGSYHYGGYSTGAPVPSSDFNGMLIYQRRRNTQPLSASGNIASVLIFGTVYAKWAAVNISGQAAFDVEFVVGSMTLGDDSFIILLELGRHYGQSKRIFLVQ